MIWVGAGKKMAAKQCTLCRATTVVTTPLLMRSGMVSASRSSCTGMGNTLCSSVWIDCFSNSVLNQMGFNLEHLIKKKKQVDGKIWNNNLRAFSKSCGLFLFSTVNKKFVDPWSRTSFLHADTELYSGYSVGFDCVVRIGSGGWVTSLGFEKSQSTGERKGSTAYTTHAALSYISGLKDWKPWCSKNK